MPTRLTIDDPKLKAAAERSVVPGTGVMAQVLNLLGLAPLGAVEAPALKSIGKPVSELLGATFVTPNKTGLPKRMAVSSWNDAKGSVGLHGARSGAEAFEATPSQLDELIDGGALGLEQPPQAAVQTIMQKLQQLLGSAGPK